MAKIYGEIESLKSLKSELKWNGISRFNSIKDCNKFLSSYQNEIKSIIKKETEQLEKEYADSCNNLDLLQKQKKTIIDVETDKIEYQLKSFRTRAESFKNKKSNFFTKLINQVKLYGLNKRIKELSNNKEQISSSTLKDVNKSISKHEIFISEYKIEKQTLIDIRTKSQIDKVHFTRKVLEKSRNLISGAIGENLVVKEIKKLSNDYVLINDFNLEFLSPLYYRKKNERIHSVQVDHLLISKAGIFIIETKNWSKASVNSLSLRSPIEQIQRSSFALYIYISDNLSLNDHHWGEQKVPIRNLIVMINHKPKGEFKYVKVKLLKELNNYLTYFEPILTDKQFNRVVSELL